MERPAAPVVAQAAATLDLEAETVQLRGRLLGPQVGIGPYERTRENHAAVRGVMTALAAQPATRQAAAGAEGEGGGQAKAASPAGAEDGDAPGKARGAPAASPGGARRPVAKAGGANR